jgi:flagellar assembly protein FliH
MSVERVIRAQETLDRKIEEFAYSSVTFTPAMAEENDDDSPLARELSTPEEEAQRLASVDQIIFQKLQKTEQEAHDIARKAYEEGFAAGEVEGRAFGESQSQAFVKRLEASLQELSAAASLIGKVAEDEILALSLALAEYLAGQQIDESPQAIQPLLISILEANPFPAPEPGTLNPQTLNIAMNPKDLEQLGDRYVGHAGLHLFEDVSLTRGSLRIEAAEGVLEATMERRRDRLMELIQRFREKARP